MQNVYRNNVTRSQKKANRLCGFLRVGLVGGNANNGVNGGSRYLNANNAPGNANTNVSSRLNLAFTPIKFIRPATWQNITVYNGFSSDMRKSHNCQAHEKER
jgi:hypothetical protein